MRLSGTVRHPTATSPAIRVAIASQVLVNTTTFMVLPYTVLHLSGTVGLGAGRAGTVVALLLLSSRLLAVGTGPLAERLGYRASMAIGLIIRGAGVALLAFGTDWTALAAAACVAGVGGALYEPALSGVLARGSTNDRMRLFVVRNQALNVGVAVGPAAAAAALSFGARGPFLMASATLGVMAGAIWLAPEVSNGGVEGARDRTPLRVHLAKALRSRSFRRLFPILVLWWAFFAQLTVSVPVAARSVGGSQRWVAIVFLLNGVTGVVALGCVRRFGRRVTADRLLTWGLLVASTGFCLLPLVGTGWWLLGGIVLYTVGESMVLPAIDLLVASLTDEATAATFFGLALAAWGVGGTAGVFLGTWLMASAGPVLPWLAYGALGLAATLATLRIRRTSLEDLTRGRLDQADETGPMRHSVPLSSACGNPCGAPPRLVHPAEGFSR